MRLTIADVFERLVAEGRATGESADRARAALEGAVETSPPWYARVIAGVGAWIATGFFIGFLFITKIVNSEEAAMIVGAVLVGAAVSLRRTADADEEFRRQLALAASLAGQVLLVFGVLDATKAGWLAALVALAVSVVLIPLVADAAQRFMSALIGSLAAIAAMADLRLAWTLGAVGPWDVAVRGSDLAVLVVVVVAAYAWRVGLRERSRDLAETLEPVGYGTVAALLLVLLFSSLFAIADDVVRGPQSTRVNAWHLGPATTVGVTVALLVLVSVILREQGARSAAALAVPVVLAALTLPTPGILAAVTLLVLAFDRRNKVLIGLATAFLVKFLSAYYYSLRMTLLAKSVLLAASGALLLAAWAYVEMRHPSRGADA